jgi:DNA-binding GntR family transcriptional regulator
LAADGTEADSARPEQIAARIVDSILAGRLAPGQRLGEQALADLFGCSRTLVREALARVAARGMVEVTSRRGWFVLQPTREHAEEAFAARQVIETGLLRSLPDAGLPAASIKRLKQHLARERAALASADAGERSWLLGDFHVCLAECAGNSLLAEILRDLTARTTLIAALYQSTHDARASCREHGEIVAALEAGDHERAVACMQAHLDSVRRHLGNDAIRGDPVSALRRALTPVAATAPAPASPPPSRPKERRP